MLLARALLVTFALSILVAPLAAEAQQVGKIYRIGYLALLPREDTTSQFRALKQRLHELGYTEGKNLLLEYRSAEGKPERLGDLAAELVRIKVDAIVGGGGTLAPLAAKRVTSTIPIVMAAVGDPVGAGLVESLARPGGNVTGLSALAADIAGKRLELLTETIPGLSRVAVILNPATPYTMLALRHIRVAAEALRVQLYVLQVQTSDDIPGAFEAAIKVRAGGLIILEDPLTFSLRSQIANLAAKSHLPTASGFREYVEVGGFFSYGTDLADLYRRAATYLDKILKGAKPADLPVEQPTRFELVINMKTAKTLGLTIPPSVLVRADQVIQ